MSATAQFVTCRRNAAMELFTLAIASCLILTTAGDAAQPPLVQSLPDTKTNRDSAVRGERTIDLLTRDVNKQLSEDQNSKFKSAIKRKHDTKHPFILTKEDLENQESIVEDNIIVESNVLRLSRPNKRVNNELARSRRVRRGWNLQHVIVPDEPLYQRIPTPEATRRWTIRPMGRSKLYWAEEPSKNHQYGYNRGWGVGVQDLHSWPSKTYG